MSSPLAAKNHVLGKFYLYGIPKAARGLAQIVVMFAVNEYCQITATASVQNSDLRIETTLEDPQKYLSDVAIKDALGKAEAEKPKDQQQVSIIEARRSANSAIANAEKELSKGTAISEQRRNEINQRVAALGLALESGILERIHVATQELLRTLASPASFQDIFKDLFGASTFVPQPSSKVGQAHSATPKAEKAVAKSTQLTSKSDPRPSQLVLGRIFGGGEFTLDSSLCFVLMPFASKFEPIYEDHIKRVITEAGLSSQRADEIASTNLITWDIWERLNKSRIVIADLTDRNPNVFYEVGLAHAISKDVILLTQSMGDIPFDLQSLRFIVYDYNPRGMVEFEKKLRSAIGAILKSS